MNYSDRHVSQALKLWGQNGKSPHLISRDEFIRRVVPLLQQLDAALALPPRQERKTL